MIEGLVGKMQGCMGQDVLGVIDSASLKHSAHDSHFYCTRVKYPLPLSCRWLALRRAAS
jgi:hypothetical protein